MNSIIFVIFRRMRIPLLLLIIAYAAVILGLTLIPGQDDQGNVWHMDFFHAVYFVSFMSTTIGFGEIPYEFTEAQRMWVIFAIYVTVVTWIYAIGTLISLFQDNAFQNAVTELHFRRSARKLRDSFYLVCGFGETGRALVQALTRRGQHVVVVDKNSLRIEELFLQNYRVRVPAFCGDARWPQNLKAAGLQHELCQGVVALTDVNETNLKIAITAKLLHPNIRVICRADSHEIEKNMKSFGTDHIFDPFDTFAEHLSMAIKSPSLHLIWSWLSVDRDPPLPEPLKPTIDRPWIVCGYGRFGKAVYQRLRDAGVRCVVIEATPERTGFPPGTYVVGRGTEAATLQQAGIHQASGLVAGTDNDANNLSIIMTAREMNRDLFVVARQNFEHNLELFEATRVDVVMHPSSIIANRIQLILGTPLLAEFLQRASYQNDDWACELVSRVSGVMEENNALDVWQVAIDCQDAYAVYELIDQGVEVCLRDLLTEFHPSEAPLQAIPLLLKREYDKLVLPEHSALLAKGDRILFCGANSVRREMEWFINNVHSLARDERSDVLKWMSGLVSRFVAGTDRVADDGNRTGTV